MEQDLGGSKPPPEGSQARQPQQSVAASGGSSVRQVVQLAVEGNYEGDIILNYNRSDIEDLDEYLKRATGTYEARMYQSIVPRPLSGEPFAMEDAQLFFGRENGADARLVRSVHHIWKDSGLG